MTLLSRLRLDAKDVRVFQVVIADVAGEERQQPVAQDCVGKYVVKWKKGHFTRLLSEVHGIKEYQRPVQAVFPFRQA